MAGTVFSAPPEINTDRELGIRVIAPETQASAMWAIARRSAQVVRNYLGKADVDKIASIKYRNRDAHQKTAPSVVTVSRGSNLWETVHGAVFAVLLRHGRRWETWPRAEQRRYQWLAAALTFEVVRTSPRKRLTAGALYRPLHHSFEKGHFPDLEKLLNLPVPAGELPEYRLYALHCHLLLAVTLEAAGEKEKQRAARLLYRMLLSGRDPVETLDFLVGNNLRTDETVQQWYHRATRKYLQRAPTSLSPAETFRRLQKLKNITIRVTTGAGSVQKQKARLSEWPEYAKKGRITPAQLSRTYRQLIQLAVQAPLILTSPVAAYARGIVKLREGRYRGFRRTIRKARKHLEKAKKRQRATDEFLDKVAWQVLPVEKNLRAYWQAVEQSRSKRKQVLSSRPEIAEFLDTVQSNFTRKKRSKKKELTGNRSP